MRGAWQALGRAAAETAIDRTLALGPTNFDNILRKVMLSLAEGDSSGARAFVRA